MLSELHIRDLALIESLSISLGAGFNVLTGETGAGKSLFVGSLELLRGETPRGGAAQWVRRGARRAQVEGVFVLDEAQAAALSSVLREELPEIAEGWGEEERGELILGRTLTAEGRTRAHLNQRPIPLRALRALAPLLIEVHGQNDHQELLEPVEQVRLLDAFGGLDSAVRSYRKARTEWIRLGDELGELEGARAERRDRLDLLRFQQGELEQAELQPGELARLVEERELLRGAGGLLADLAQLGAQLAEAEGNVLQRLQNAGRTLERWRDKITRLNECAADLESAQVHVEEATAALNSVADEVEADPGRLEWLEARLAELERLIHKYDTDEEGLLEKERVLSEEIEDLARTDEDVEELRERAGAARGQVASLGGKLAKKRRGLRSGLTRQVAAVLADLGLDKAVFELDFQPRSAEPERDHLGPHGCEDVEFLLAANPGEPAHPLRRVASGGEAARIMLALRTVLSAADRERTLVFDEIDTGVGGRLGPQVGRHLRKVAERHQVLCVTHQPAIAASAHVHLHVTKHVERGRTRTAIEPLEGNSRVSEVADMIAGGAAEKTARAEARRLIAEAHAS